jgi:hypothetical protein
MHKMVDTIPQEVLHDYQNRTVVSVSNLRWNNAEHTMFTADVLFEELEALGAIPFTTTADTDTKHGLEIWEKANAGAYGAIAEYVPPTVEQIRAQMPPITPRQLRLTMLTIGLTEQEILDYIALIENPEAKAFAEIEWKWASVIQRNHPLVDVIRASLENMTEENLDSLWMYAAAL